MSLGSCSLPFMVSKYVKNTVVIFSVMNCLSGGVVLGAALSHMIPSATQNFVDYFANKENSPFKDYPFTPAICAVGLLLLLTIDRTLLSEAHSHSEIREHDSHTTYTKSPHTSHKHITPVTTYNTSGSQKYLTPETPSLSTPSLPHHGSHSKYTSLSSSMPLSQHGSQKFTSTDSVPIYIQSPSPSEPLLHEINTPRIDVGFNTDALNKSISDYNAGSKSAVTKTWVFLLALSVHSVLEGLGMGAENDREAFFSVLFAVLAHKCLEAFALGLSIFYARFKRVVTVFMILGYSFATPLGVAVGMISDTLSSDQNLMAGILVSLASGSFLYISLIEILPTELHKPHAMGWILSFFLLFILFFIFILFYF
eukprot:Phypoly_transcript_07104.p1 GENE.Phypoly_transcript_07104~~Phypoly_transcript_07104.p1  ORF type:complete len:417 (+),score=57.29 Phypoly_transcript_07104:152-1252(+)